MATINHQLLPTIRLSIKLGASIGCGLRAIIVMHPNRAALSVKLSLPRSISHVKQFLLEPLLFLRPGSFEALTLLLIPQRSFCNFGYASGMQLLQPLELASSSCLTGLVSICGRTELCYNFTSNAQQGRNGCCWLLLLLSMLLEAKASY